MQTRPRLSVAQAKSWRDSFGRVNLWEGAIRSGKTFVSLFRWAEFVVSAPVTGALVMVGKSRETLYRNVIQPLLTRDEFAPLRPFMKYTSGSPHAVFFGRRIEMLGASDVASEGRIRGMTVLGAYIDELTLIPENFFKQMLGRMSAPGAMMFATTNPDSPAHWLKTTYLDHLTKYPNWRRFHFNMEDNVALDPTYIADVKREYTGLWYKRFILGLWVAAEGAIFNMWDPDIHVRPWAQAPTMRQLVAVGMDYGTTNATAALLLGISRELVGTQYKSRLWLVDEWRYDSRAADGITKPDVELSRMFRDWLDQPHLPPDNPGNGYQPRFIVLDPSAASMRAQLHKDKVNTWPGDNSVGQGIALVANLLTEQKLMVTDRCQGFISEAPGYAWDPKKSQAGFDVPVKVADHSLDGARYAIKTTESTWRRQVDWPDQLALAA